jgi:hypothetical protein
LLIVDERWEMAVGRWEMTRKLTPGTQELDMVSHFVGRLGRHEPEQSPFSP